MPIDLEQHIASIRIRENKMCHITLHPETNKKDILHAIKLTFYCPEHSRTFASQDEAEFHLNYQGFKQELTK